MKTTIYTLILTFLLASAACEGPAGPQGIQGESGSQGEQGAQGERGNADIMYSEWMDIEWGSESNTVKQMAIDAPQITSDFLNEGGTILMFMKREVPVQGGGNADLIHPLPYLSGNNFHGFYVVHGEGINGIHFHIYSVDGITPIPENQWAGHQIRYVLAPGSVNLAGKGVDVNDYEQLVEYYGMLD